MSPQPKLHASIILTYRCNARCNMCHVWQHPSKPAEEIDAAVLAKLPPTFFTNITGGEPFIRQDLAEIVDLLQSKSRRIVISTNGYFTERIIALCQRYPQLGIRISLEGLPKTNDMIRGIPDGFDRALRTLLELRAMGLQDIGFAMTIQEVNCQDLLPLYHLARGLGYEFATAVVHNSHYFHKWDNQPGAPEKLGAELKKLIQAFLCSRRPKDWFRAYFNYGLLRFAHGQQRLLPCRMGSQGFFVDPWGDVLACNGMDQKVPLGNLREASWQTIWEGPQAAEVRRLVANCTKNCWMIGSAAPAMWQNLMTPLRWIISNKLKIFLGRDIKLDLQ